MKKILIAIILVVVIFLGYKLFENYSYSKFLPNHLDKFILTQKDIGENGKGKKLLVANYIANNEIKKELGVDRITLGVGKLENKNEFDEEVKEMKYLSEIGEDIDIKSNFVVTDIGSYTVFSTYDYPLFRVLTLFKINENYYISATTLIDSQFRDGGSEKIDELVLNFQKYLLSSY